MTRRWTLAILLALWIALPLVAQKAPSPHEGQLRRIEQALDREIPIGKIGYGEQVREFLEVLLEPVKDLLHFDSRIEPFLRQRTLTVKPEERTARQILDRLRNDHKIHAVPAFGRFVFTHWQGANSLPRKLPRPDPAATKKARELHQFLRDLGPKGAVQLRVQKLHLRHCTDLVGNLMDRSQWPTQVYLTLSPKLAKQPISIEFDNTPILEALTLLAWQAGGKLRYAADGLEVITIEDARTH